MSAPPKDIRRRYPPGPQGVGFLRHVPGLVADPLKAFTAISQRYGDLVYLQFGDAETFLLNHPDLIREVFVTKTERFGRTRLVEDLLPLIGNGLLSSDETYWVEQRRRLNPAFGRAHDRLLLDAQASAVADVTRDWRAAGTVDVQAALKELQLHVLIRSLFSPDAAYDAPAIIHALDTILQFASIKGNFVRRLWRDVAEPVGLPPLRGQRIAGALAEIDAFLYGVIRRCRTGEREPGLVMALLLAAMDDGAIDEKQARDELATLLFAGFDTTACLLTFALGALARHPGIQDAVRAEAQALPAAPTYADLGQQPLTRQVLLETLRLYPPAWSYHRSALEATEVGAHEIPIRGHVMVCAWALHRHPAWWDAPEAFRPERFVGDRVSEALVGFHYGPFGQGRHTCIGKRMALMQAHATLAWLTRAFRFWPATARSPKVVPGIILKAKGGMPLRVEPV